MTSRYSLHSFFALGVFALCACALLLAPQKALAKVVFLTTTGAQSWTVPSDWNDNNNTIEVIGGGGGGGDSGASTGGGGGAGGAYSSVSGVDLTPGASVSYFVGTGGARGATGVTGGDTYFNGASCGAASACAKGGTGGTNAGAAGTGGAAGSGQGTTKKSGGNGGSASGFGGGAGGGGAGGPHGDGKVGGNGVGAGGAGGGGAANNGSVGGSASSDQGAAGGNGRGGSGGGTAGAPGGGNGSSGGGGGGGDFLYQDVGNDGGTGGKDSIWTQTTDSATAGPGGGGGGGGSVNDDNCFCYGGGTGGTGASGAYGGGGGGGGAEISNFGQGVGGAGKQGIVVVTYIPGITFNKPSNNLGLLGYWNMNEGTGSVVGDFSGNNYYGTTTASPTWVSSVRGKALDFNGSTQHAGMSAPATVADNLSSMTVSTWFKTTDSSAEILVSKIRNTGSTAGWLIGKNNTGSAPGQISFYTQQDGTNYHGRLTANRYDDGKWHHFAATLSGGVGGTITLYVDGIAVSMTSDDSGTVSSITNTEQIRFATMNDLSGQFYTGSLDEVRVYSRALSATETAALYAGGVSKMGASSVDLQRGSTIANGLIEHYTFDGADATDTAITDRSGQGNTGYLRNRATSSAKAIGKLGQALNFDGVDDFVWIIDATDPNQNTISMWVKPYLKTSSAAMFVRTSLLTGPLSYWNLSLRISSGGFFEYYLYDGAAQQVTGTTRVATSTWYHVVGTTGAGGTMRLYVNGVEEGTPDSVGTVDTTGDRNYIGSETGDSMGYFSGEIDDVRLYNRGLSASEVKQLYKLGTATIR